MQLHPVASCQQKLRGYTLLSSQLRARCCFVLYEVYPAIYTENGAKRHEDRTRHRRVFMCQTFVCLVCTSIPPNYTRGVVQRTCAFCTIVTCCNTGRRPYRTKLQLFSSIRIFIRKKRLIESLCIIPHAPTLRSRVSTHFNLN